MKIRSLFLLLLFFPVPDTLPQHVLIETNFGNITIKLYDETPMHKENFLHLVNSGFYNNLLFHRLIKEFIIQTGDTNSKNAKPGQRLGYGGMQYTIPAEFNKNYYHKKGALAAARQPDNLNPQKESSCSQFYIVVGRKFTDAELNAMEQKQIHIRFTAEQRKIYKTTGGTPHLDYSYTVFGEVLSGFDVLDKIAASNTDSNDRPLVDIRLIKMVVIK